MARHEVHTFGCYGHRFALDPECMEVSEMGEPNLRKMERGDVSSRTIRAYQKALDDTTEKLSAASPLEFENITDIALLVSQECNLRCVYCYADGGRYDSGGYMEEETALRSVDWLIQHSGDQDRICIRFYGGEPFLKFDLIKRVVKYSKRRAEEVGKRIHFCVTTNAALLNAESIGFVKEHNIDVVVSMDGPKDIQDTQRPCLNGKGSYEKTVGKVKSLLKARPETFARATVYDESPKERVIEGLREIGFKTPLLTHLSGSMFLESNAKQNDDKLMSLIEEEGQSFLKNLRDRNETYFNQGRIAAMWGRMIRQAMELFISSSKKTIHCSAGRWYVAISCAGEIYPCHRLVGVENEKIGNVFENALEREAYRVGPLPHQEKCQSCFARYVCAGSCFHDNLTATGSIYETDEIWCRLVRRTVEYGAAIAGSLSQEDKAFLQSQECIPEESACPLDLF